MAEIVSVELARLWLKREDADVVDDEILTLCLATAQALIVDYVKQRHYEDEADLTAWIAEVDAWTSETAPVQVRAAILRLAADLDYDRGDMAATEQIERRKGELPDHVTSLLYRLRDPAVA